MEKTVNMRSKRTESETAAIIALWSARRDMVDTRKKYEDLIEKDNNKIKLEIKKILESCCVALDTPIEFIIEANRCLIQARLYSTPKAKSSWFVTTISQSIGPLESYMKDNKGLVNLGTHVKKAIRRINALTKKKLARTISPQETTLATRIQDMKRRPDEPMVVVTYNVRTRYDF